MRIKKTSLHYLLVLLPLILGCTQAAAPATLFPYRARAWNKTPTIVVLGQEGDPRNQFVSDAVEFWNGQLTQIGSGFRLEPVRFVNENLPANDSDLYDQRKSGGTRLGRDIVSPGLKRYPTHRACL